jgi:hypothetical protein
VLSHRRVTGGRDERSGTGALWTAAVLLPALCCAALPLLVATGVGAGIVLLAFGVTLGALMLGAAVVGLVFTLRRRRAQTSRLPVERI